MMIENKGLKHLLEKEKNVDFITIDEIIARTVFNYSFEVGDLVRIHPAFTELSCTNPNDLTQTPYRDYVGRVGVVTRSYSDLHSMSGSSWSADVEYDDGQVFSTFAGVFILYRPDNDIIEP